MKQQELEKENKKLSILDVIQGIQHAMKYVQDGAIDDNGKPVKIGLQREKGNPLLDKRVIDGFTIGFSGPYLHINYHTESSAKEKSDERYPEKIAGILEDIEKFLKEQFKNHTGKALGLEKEGSLQIQYFSINNNRHDVVATCVYCIKNIEKEFKNGDFVEKPEKVKRSIKEFMTKLRGRK